MAGNSAVRDASIYNNMKLFIRLSGIWVIGAWIACSPFSRTAKENEKEFTAPVNGKFIPVTVTDFSGLDGCTFLLLKENGEKLQPVNLPDSLQKDKLRIRITFVPEHAMGICMAGQMVRITGIQTIK